MNNRLLKTARVIRRNQQFELLSRFGYITNGILHVLIGIAIISLSIGIAKEADQSSVLLPLAHNWFGLVLLILIFIGLCSLGLWQIIRVIIMRKQPYADRKWPHQLIELSKGIAYLVLGLSTLTYAFATSATESSISRAQHFALNILSLPAGTMLLFLFGLIIIGIGCFFCYRGASREFLKAIDIHKVTHKKFSVLLGIYGYCAKGLTFVLVGILFCQAAITVDATKASGLDGAFVTLLSLPFGTVLAFVLGIGFIVYAAYCVVRGRYAKL